MTLSPSLRGGSSYTGAILPPKPPRLGAAGFTDPVEPGFIQRAVRRGAQPRQEPGVEVLAHPPAHALLCGPHRPSPLPQLLILPRTQAPPPRLAAGVRPLPLPLPLLGRTAGL